MHAITSCKFGRKVYYTLLYKGATVNATSLSSTQYETLSPTTAELAPSVQTSITGAPTILMPTSSDHKDMPPLLATDTNIHERGTIQTREIVAWCLAVLLTILSTVLLTVVIFTAIRTIHNRKRNTRRKEIQAQEDELEDNPGYEASNARPSLCEVMENPCYIATQAKRVSESDSVLYESIKLEHFYTYAQR